ncbi:MAG: sulfatase [Marinicellaceae bacterium]
MGEYTRRKFIKSFAQSAVAASLTHRYINPRNSKKQPNIIILLADDQRNDTLGCAGHPIVQTPNIDLLASEGTKFNNAFVTTSICTASRASILTGLFERTHGFSFNKPPIQDMDIANSYTVKLRQHGYKSGFVGKFGIKVTPEAMDTLFDYQEFFPRAQYFFKMEDGSIKHEIDHAVDLAINFIKQEQNNPFVMTISFNSPHADPFNLDDHFPWPESSNGLYENITIPEPLLSDESIFNALPEFLKTSLNRERFFWRWDTDEKYQKNMKAYFRMITGIDTAIGRLRQQLQHLKIDNNTVIIYLADNGYYMGNRGFAGKWSHYEESLRIPMIIFDPRTEELNKGKNVNSMVLNIDLAPTLLEIAGASIPHHYQGLSLMPLVHGLSIEWRSDFFCEHLLIHAGIPKWEGVRTENFMYARYFEQDPVYEFLHEFETDPNELVNLASNKNYQIQLKQLRNRCDNLVEQYTPKPDAIFKNSFE